MKVVMATRLREQDLYIWITEDNRPANNPYILPWLLLRRKQGNQTLGVLERALLLESDTDFGLVADFG